MLTILYVIHFQPHSPFPTAPTAPFGVPMIWSLAFWGGVWGLVFGALEGRFPRDGGYWIAALLFGAIGPSAVAWFIVSPIKGLPMAAGWLPGAIVTGLCINGAWGIGTALLLRGFCGHRM